MFKLESRNVGAANDFVVGVHVTGCAMGLGVLDLVEVHVTSA